MRKPDLDTVLYQERNYPVEAQVCDDKLIVLTGDGRAVHVPLSWYPWLQAATPEQRSDFEISGWMIYWNQLDEGMTIETILLGRHKA